MSVKAVVIDVSGTIQSSGVVTPGVVQMTRQLDEQGVYIVLASTQSPSPDPASLGVIYDFMLTRADVGAWKGSPKWVRAAADLCGVEPEEIVWLGDDKLDMRSAVNAKVPYFHADWSNPGYEYGFPVDTPAAFAAAVLHCLQRVHPWYWQLDETDKRGQVVSFAALMDGGGAGSPDLKRRLLSLIKSGGQSSVGPLDLADFIMLSLVGAIIHSKLLLEADLWTVYPGSAGGVNPVLAPHTETFAKQLRDKFFPDLLVRHTAAPDTSLARYRGETVRPITQFETVHVNPAYRQLIQGRQVVVVDDFTTSGASLECARNLLLQAGASGVRSIALGKYGRRASVITLLPDVDPFVPLEVTEGDLHVREVTGTTDDASLDDLRDAFEALCA